MREVPRRVRVRAIVVGDDVVMLVAGSTANRWKLAAASVDEAVGSFSAREAPEFSSEMVGYRKRVGK